MTWIGQPRELRSKTHCVHGHELTEENTYRLDDGWRRCKQCRRESHTEYMRRWRARKCA